VAMSLDRLPIEGRYALGMSMCFLGNARQPSDYLASELD